MKSIQFPSEVSTLPETPGVYQYRDKNGHILYIGKAKNLKNRIRSYTASNLLLKTAKMVSEAVTLTYIEVQSEFEALLLEANLVRSHMPLYNIELKDDKSPLYIGITKEEYPRVLILRQTQLPTIVLKKTFGPYIDGRSAKYVLHALRKIFPFSTHRIGKRACIYKEIGLCNPCPSEIAALPEGDEKQKLKAEYLKNIRRLSLVLDGRARTIEKELVFQMERAAKIEEYETAQRFKDKLSRFHRTLGTSLKLNEYIVDPNFIYDIHKKELLDLQKTIEQFTPCPTLSRIECFDIAHLSGVNPTASMVTFTEGEPNKKYYRHFKINKGKRQNSDVDSMKEVVERRLKHFADWGIPDLIIIDGGKAQISAVAPLLQGKVVFVGLAKRFETLVFWDEKSALFRQFVLPDGPAKNLVVRTRDEAHRFARRLHHNLVTKTLLNKI